MAARTGKADMDGSPEATRARTDFGLSLTVFAKMTGVPAAVAKWEEGKGRLSGEALGRIDRVAHILRGLGRVMRRSFVPTWVEQPTDACAERVARTPLDLFERGDYEALESMVYYMESGTPD
jgi:hypothetical protein